jgi:predicted tellurium resistance membrane protein TerC
MPSAWIGLLTLIALEIVLGIDNIVFISILSGKLPPEQQAQGRKTGMTLAVIPRIVLLLFIPLVLSMKNALFKLPFKDPHTGASQIGISLQDLVLIIGGIFLLGKAAHELHSKLEGDGHIEDDPNERKMGSGKFAAVMVQIMLLNIVFSLDSIVTAIGMIPPSQVTVMILAVLISTGIMALTEKHPGVKILALSFLLLIGFNLVIEGFHFEIPQGYVYFSMGFSVFVQILNIKASSDKHNKAVELIEPKL